MAEHTIINSLVPMTFTYKYRAGEYMNRYLDGLKEKKIWGVKCPECERVMVPPRAICGRCNVRMKKWVRIKPVGTLKNFTVASVDIEQGEIKDREQPMIIGQIKLEGADSLLTAKVEGISPEAVKPGIKLQAVWTDSPAGALQDLDHFAPANKK